MPKNEAPCGLGSAEAPARHDADTSFQTCFQRIFAGLWLRLLPSIAADAVRRNLPMQQNAASARLFLT